MSRTHLITYRHADALFSGVNCVKVMRDYKEILKVLTYSKRICFTISITVLFACFN